MSCVTVVRQYPKKCCNICLQVTFVYPHSRRCLRNQAARGEERLSHSEDLVDRLCEVWAIEEGRGNCLKVIQLFQKGFETVGGSPNGKAKGKVYKEGESME